MECNKEEASRAKDLAELKLQKADFVGAKRMALKAHQLFPELENISQLLAVCEVHCCAAAKINGETDWYGILQAEATADDMLLKKQYRKLALLLHPDKNKFAGAEAAFKLIGEAHMTLTDQVKRSLHDSKRKPVSATSASVPKKRGRPPKRTDTVAKRANKENIDVPLHQKKTQQQSGSFAGYSSFWTICLTCGTKYQYPCILLMKVLLCRVCTRSFLAYDLSKKPAPVQGETLYPWSGFGVHQEKFPPNQQAHATNQHQKYQTVSAQQNPVTSHKTHATDQQQQSQNVSDQQTPVANLSQQPQKLPFNAESKNAVSSDGAGDPNKESACSNVTAKVETCTSTKISRPAPKEEYGAGRTEPPLDSSDEVPLANKQQTEREVAAGSSYKVTMDSNQVAIEKDVLTMASPDKTAGSNLERSSQQENNAVNEDDCGVRRKGSTDLPDSPAAKRLRKGHSSCSDVKSGERINQGANVCVQQRCIPSTEKTPNENGQVINHLDLDKKKETPKKGEMPSSGNHATARSVDNSAPCKGAVSCPDSEFYDFEKNRDADRFSVDQIWAIYDDNGCMPRYYGRIKQVYSPNFMLRLTWLELAPENDAEKTWFSKELPVACGNFRIGKTILTEDTKMFSHVISWNKGRKRNSYEIYPRKGDVWALFKDWNINWSSDCNDRKDYNYDIVEVESDFSVGIGTYVIPLVHVKGFVSLFVRSNNEEPYLIPSGDTLSFSHSIPFHRLQKTDAQHVPNGALELDPASLPTDLEQLPSVDLDNNFMSNCEGNTGCNVSSDRISCNGEIPEGKTKHGLDGTARNEEHVHDGTKKPPNAQSEQDSEASVIDVHGSDEWFDSESQLESPASFDYPNPDFHNFSDIRSFNKFKNGQIWAIYCDTDKFPKYYGLIKGVDPDDFTIHIRWLEYCPCVEVEKHVVQEGHPVGSGIFRVSRQSNSYDCTSVFSHIMEATPINKGKKYEILPCVGQVWTVYKNWSCGWSLKNYEICEYDLVEILEVSNASIIVSYLTKVEGFSSVFMPEKKGDCRSALKIPKSDMMMFSHQIPAYRLKNEDKKLCGYWELDPASVPEFFFLRKSK